MEVECFGSLVDTFKTLSCIEISEDSYHCFVDGSSVLRNGSYVAGWSWIVVSSETGNVVKFGDSQKGIKGTNNYSELRGMIDLVENLPDSVVCRIYSDSEYVLRYLFKYEKGSIKQKKDIKFAGSFFSKEDISGWLVNGPKTHHNLWERLVNSLEQASKRTGLYFYWIRGHQKADGPSKGRMLNEAYFHNLVDSRARSVTKNVIFRD